MIHKIISGFRFRLRRHARRLARDERGVSAVEFALILPMMATLYFGVVEASQAISIDRKVTLASRTVADLVAQVSTISASDVGAVLDASTVILAPYSSGNAKVTVSLVQIDKNSNATVVWSRATKGNARGKGESVSVPAALKTADTHLIWGEAVYDYEPTVAKVIVGKKKLTDNIFMRPRLSESVTCSNC